MPAVTSLRHKKMVKNTHHFPNQNKKMREPIGSFFHPRLGHHSSLCQPKHKIEKSCFCFHPVLVHLGSTSYSQHFQQGWQQPCFSDHAMCFVCGWMRLHVGFILQNHADKRTKTSQYEREVFFLLNWRKTRRTRTKNKGSTCCLEHDADHTPAPKDRHHTHKVI